MSTTRNDSASSFRINRLQFSILLSLSLFGWTDASARGASPQRFALLVGVQEYPNLEESEQLRGSRNDVQLMSKLLIDRFQFPPENVRVVLDKDATGAAIRGQFEALVQRVAAVPQDTPVYVVFHFSGHGSQVPDQPSGSDTDEQDAMDETIVPYDAKRQGGDADIRDDELNAFAHRICERKQSQLWMVLDCCHSGTGVRGSSSTRFRALDRKFARIDDTAGQSRDITEKTLPPGAVAFYACQSMEMEPEYQDGDRCFGLLTRFLTKVLSETGDLSKLSYGLLAEVIESRYRQDRRVIPAPRPRVEGESREIVCGAGPELDRAPYWRVSASPSDRSQVSIAAGSFHGITVGSLFQLYRTAEHILGSEDQAVAWLRIREVDLTTSTASVLQRDGNEWFEAKLPRTMTRGLAMQRYHDHGDFGTHVRVVVAVDDQHDSSPLMRDDPRVPAAVREAFAKSRRDDESGWLHWAESNEQFDLLLRIDQPYAALFPAIAMTYLDQNAVTLRGDGPRSLLGGWGPVDLRGGPQAAREIQESIRRITRARNLIRLVDLQQPQAKSSMRVELTLEELQVSDELIVSRASWVSLHRDAASASDINTVRDGQFYDWRVTYTSDTSKPVYVTVLQVDSNMGIQTMLPAQLGAESPRLQPGGSITAGGYECCRDDQGKAEFGPRWTIILATYEPNHYSWLSQDSLPRIRGSGFAGWTEPGTPQSSLDDLLLGEMYFKSRGAGPASSPTRNLFDPGWSVELRRWLAVSGEEHK